MTEKQSLKSRVGGWLVAVGLFFAAAALCITIVLGPGARERLHQKRYEDGYRAGVEDLRLVVQETGAERLSESADMLSTHASSRYLLYQRTGK